MASMHVFMMRFMGKNGLSRTNNPFITVRIMHAFFYVFTIEYPVR